MKVACPVRRGRHSSTVRLLQSKDWPRSTRPVIMGTRHMVSAGHYLAAAGGYRRSSKQEGTPWTPASPQDSVST